MTKQFTLALMLLCVLCVLCAGCGQSPTAPNPQPLTLSPTSAPLLCASGQSNMGDGSLTRGLLPALKLIAHAQGWDEGAQPIEFWDEGQRGWLSLVPFLTPQCTVFIWFQGETPEALGPDYLYASGSYTREALALFARVRALTSPALPMYVIQIAPRFTVTRAEQVAACTLDPHCTYVLTDDLTFPDGIHLDDASYRILAQRIVGLVR